MGRQTSRIWLADGTDHKEMVTWTGTEYQYHDKAYIWNGASFQLVWQKIKSLTCLYEVNGCFKPAASANNRYVYFANMSRVEFSETYVDGREIYRITIDDPESEPPLIFEDSARNKFNAVTSSQGFGMQYRVISSTEFEYRMLDFDNGEWGYYEDFKAEEHDISAYSLSRYSIDEISSSSVQGTSGTNTLRLGAYMLNNAYYLIWNHSVARGVNFTKLSNEIGSLPMDTFYHLDDFRFIKIQTASGALLLLEVWVWTGISLMQIYTDTAPFNIVNSRFSIKGLRNGKFAVESDNYEIWIIEAGESGFTYTNTGIKSENGYYGFDISPDYKYVLTFTVEGRTGTIHQIHPLIVNIETGQTEIDLWDEITDLGIRMDYDSVFQPFFVGDRCLCVGGFKNNYVSTDNQRQRLYKWR